MENDINTNLIKELLNSSTTQIAPATLEKLRMARTNALGHQRSSSSVPVLSWVGHHGGRHESYHMSKSMTWAVAALFVACLLSGAAFWQNYTSEHEINELDIAILTGELPLHVFVD
jgi:hypothetical protein